MTRWARVGNSQKHKKLPEDATPWKDFWQNRSAADSVDGNKVKSGRIEKKKQKLKKFDFNVERKISEDLDIKNNSKLGNVKQEGSENNLTLSKFSSENVNEINEHFNKAESSNSQVLSRKQLKKAKKKAKLQQLKKSELNDKQDNNTLTTDMLQTDTKFSNEKTGSQVLSKKQFKKAKKKAKLQQLKNAELNVKQDNNTSSKILTTDVLKTDSKSSNEKTDSQILSKKQLKKAKKKAKLQQLQNAESNDKLDNNNFSNAQTTEVLPMDTKSSNENDFQGKKLFMKKHEQKKKKGNMIIPPKIKRRLYNIKKCLREKGLSPTAIKEIIRKERKNEEQLKFQRSVSSKPCFNCRQIGHLLADCPIPLGDSNQETGICFKCGSPEHTSYKCPEEIKGYPLAKCFVCKEQGHISKDCPKNSHGVYIKGGKCILCGNVNHLKKDCPTLKSKKDKEVDITAYTIDEGKSVDAEIMPEDDIGVDRKISSIKKEKKAKVIKF